MAVPETVVPLLHEPTIAPVDTEFVPDNIIELDPATHQNLVLKGLATAIGAARYGIDFARGVDGLLRPSDERRGIEARTSVETLETSSGLRYNCLLTKGLAPEESPSKVVVLPYLVGAESGIGRGFHYHVSKLFPGSDVFTPGVEGLDTNEMTKEQVDEETFETMAMARLEMQYQMFGSRPVEQYEISQGGAIGDQMEKLLRTIKEQSARGVDWRGFEELEIAKRINYVGSGMRKLSLKEATTELGIPTGVNTVLSLGDVPPLHLARHFVTLAGTAKWGKCAFRPLVRQAQLNLDGPSIGIGPHLVDGLPKSRVGGSADKVFAWEEQLKLVLGYPNKDISLTVYDGLTHAAATHPWTTMRHSYQAYYQHPVSTYRGEEIGPETAHKVAFLRDTGRLHYLDRNGQEMPDEYVETKIAEALNEVA